MHYEAELVILFLLLGLVHECCVICRVVEGNGASGLEMIESHILLHSSIGNCGSLWCDDREGYEVRMTHLERIDGESCGRKRKGEVIRKSGSDV